MAIASTTATPVRSTRYPLEFSRIFSTTPGVLSPVWGLTTMPGDRLQIRSDIAVDTLPVETPAYVRFRAQARCFWTDFRAYIPSLALDFVGLNPVEISLPVIHLPLSPGDLAAGGSNTAYPVIYPSVSTNFVAPGHILNFLYYPAGSGLPWSVSSKYSDVQKKLYSTYPDLFPSLFPLLVYYHTYYKYYMNPQEPKLRVITKKGSGNTSAYAGDYTYIEIPGSNLKDVFINASRGWFYRVPNISNDPTEAFGPDPFFFAPGNYQDVKVITDIPALHSYNLGAPLGGLAVLPYLPSVNECWINGSSISTIHGATQIDTVSLDLDSLIAKDKLRKYLSLGLFGASGYMEWAYSQFAVTPRKGFSSPQYLGGSEFLIGFSEVIATSAEGLGEQGGKGSGSGKLPQRRYSFDSYGFFQVLFDIRPILNYNSGLDTSLLYNTLSDLPSFETSSMPWEALHQRDLFCRPILGMHAGTIDGVAQFIYSYLGVNASMQPGLDTLGPEFLRSTIVGYRPAWTAYRSAYNRAIGLLEDDQSLSTWTLSRNYLNRVVAANKPENLDYLYEYTPTTYIDLADMNGIFVDNSLTAQNFLVAFNFDVVLDRPLTNSAVPTF